MKITISIFLYCAFAIGVLAGDNTKQMTKNVDAPADLPKEVAAYYNNLVEKDEDVQKQVAPGSVHSTATMNAPSRRPL